MSARFGAGMRRSSAWLTSLTIGLVLIAGISLRPREDRTCEVIRAFQSEILDHAQGYAPLLSPRAQPTSNAWYLLWLAAPFERADESVGHPDMVFTPLYAPQLWSSHSPDFRSCFDGRLAPPFHDGEFSELGVAAMHQEPFPMLWTLSPVGFVGDREAMFYAECECGGLCGGGGFYLWRHTTRGWRFVAYSEVWIS
jgi:hypothetical protein